MPEPGGNNPFEQYPLQPSYRNESMQMRMMMNADRMGQMNMPRGRAGGRSGQQGINPMLGAMAGNSGDYSAFTYDPQLNAQAQAAGVTPLRPDQVNPNAIFPNSGFFGAHPRLTSILEGGIFGAAATRGSDTVGEGISNVASGLLEGRMAKQGIVNRQFQQPFNSANMLESLQDKIALRKYRDSEQQHLDAENARYKHDATYQDRREADQHLTATRPLEAAGGAWTVNPSAAPGTNPWSFQEGPGGKEARESNKWANTGPLRSYLAEQGVTDPAQATKQQWKQAQRNYQQDQVSLAGRKAGASTDARNDANQDGKDANARRAFVEKTLSRPSAVYSITGKVYGQNDSAQASKDIGDYYDKNLAPNPSPMPQTKIPTFNPATGQLE